MKGKTAEIGVLLDKYIPSVEQMHTTMKKYQVAFTETASENEALKTENAQLEKIAGKSNKGKHFEKAS